MSAGTGNVALGSDDASGAEPSGGAPASTLAPYANVTAVSTAGAPSAYQLQVSIESADLDCSQYADWWEVLTQEGSLIFRRILEHSHTDDNGTSDPGGPGNTFTRDGGPVDVASDTIVLVRAHMHPTGYLGQVMRGSAETGFEAATDVDPGFAAAVEHDAPQPTSCLF